VLVALAVAYAYVTFTEITTQGYVSEAADANIVYALIFADYSPLFWAFVGCGLVVPVVVMAVPRLRTGAWIGLASAGVVVAMFIKRVLIIVPAEAQPLIAGATAAYSPSGVELAIVAGGGGGIVLILLVIFRLVPVLAIYEIGEIEGRGEEPARAASAVALEVTT
jgi:molybdopterin-containing oxidoreductase family membrane subunit